MALKWIASVSFALHGLLINNVGDAGTGKRGDKIRCVAESFLIREEGVRRGSHSSIIAATFNESKNKIKYFHHCSSINASLIFAIRVYGRARSILLQASVCDVRGD